MLQCSHIRAGLFRFRKVDVVYIHDIFYDVYETYCLNFCELSMGQHRTVGIELRFLGQMRIAYLP